MGNVGEPKPFAEDFVRDIPRGVPTRFLRRQTVPQAQWQAPDVIMEREALAYDPDKPGRKILVGAFDSKLIGIDDNRHILTVAGSRAGKSVMLVANLAFYRGSVLATDPKAELATLTAARRAALGQKVFVLDPFEHAAGEAVRFRAAYNPLSVLTLQSPTVVEDAGLISDALVVAGSGKDPHWDESAKNFIEGIILHVATAPRYEGRRNLPMVREVIKLALMKIEPDDPEESPYFAVEDEMQKNAAQLAANKASEALAGAIEGAARDFYEKPENERASVLSTARRHTKFLDYAAMRKVLSGHDFDLADLKRAPAGVSVFLCLPASRIGMCNRWLRIFVNQVLDAMEREKRKPDAPVLVCLDEFPVLGHMRQLEDAAGQIASFDVKLWVMLQDWGQGKALYGDRWETFAGNAGILQFFGNNDLATTEYISKRLGKTRVDVARSGEVTQQQRESGMVGRSESGELFDLLTPDEVSVLFARSDRLKRQLVIWAGYDPLILQRVEYFDRDGPHYQIFRGKIG